MRDYRRESFWLDTLGEELKPRPALDADTQCDVAIVGAGYTGLWTAWALLQRDPSLDVVLCESDIAGAGASGRNGGWCMGEMMGVHGLFSHPEHGESARRLQRELFATVDEIGRTVAAEGIDCHFAKAGMLRLASVPAHRERLLAQMEGFRAQGFDETDYRWLEAEECRERIWSRDFLGGIHAPHAAVLDPARLVRGLARAVERRGARLYEKSRVRHFDGRSLQTDRARVRADRVVLATEGYTPELAGRRRQLIPVHSMMIATEPLPREVWAQIGLERRETFADVRRITIYGQRTVDDRIAFGGRGLYYYGSKVLSHFAHDNPVFERVRRALIAVVPQIASAGITHHWGGPLGVPRDWKTAITVDEKTGVLFGGGYVGEGVAASHLIGSTMADLLCGIVNERTQLPWLVKKSSTWEPEPLRWLGVTAVRTMGQVVDRGELSGRRPNPIAKRFFDWMTS